MDWKVIAEVGFLVLAGVAMFAAIYWVDRLYGWLTGQDREQKHGGSGPPTHRKP